jgi:cysteine synthase
VAAALRLAAETPGLTVATVACDTGTRYLSTDLFARD